MNNIVNINQLYILPDNKLAIIKDLNSILFFGIKTSLPISSDLAIKALTIIIQDIPHYVLLLKSNHSDIYRCTISFTDKEQKKSLYKFVSQKSFNLIVFRDKEQEIIRIENKNKKNLKKAFLKPLLISSIDTYSNEQLWDIAL